MTRTPPAVARRLDRLARRAHRFHRFAHHPLCDAYASEVVHLPRRQLVCRGCALAAIGATAGLVAGLALPALALGAFSLAAAGAAPALAAVRLRAGRARSKLLTRALPAALLAATVGHALRHRTPAALLAGVAAVLAGWIAVRAYRHRGPKRAACASCPERDGPRTCSGYAPIVRRERAFARVAARLLAR